jgi:hypothetical protein
LGFPFIAFFVVPFFVVLVGGCFAAANFFNARFRAGAFFFRTITLAAAAFLARALRSSGVMFFAAVFPPEEPYFFPYLEKKANASGGSLDVTIFLAYTLLA